MTPDTQIREVVAALAAQRGIDLENTWPDYRVLMGRSVYEDYVTAAMERTWAAKQDSIVVVRTCYGMPIVVIEGEAHRRVLDLVKRGGVEN